MKIGSCFLFVLLDEQFLELRLHLRLYLRLRLPDFLQLCFSLFRVVDWILLAVEVPQKGGNSEHYDHTQLNNDDGEVGLSFAIPDAAVSDPVLIFPALIPAIEDLDVALQLVVAEGDSSGAAVVEDLEGVGLVRVLVDFKN